jgi:amidophosphoribosyltransferase
VDDSVVRGTTAMKIYDMVVDAGAAEVHLRLAAPPAAGPCVCGVDTPNREKLLASTMSAEEMREHLGVPSLKFVSLDGLYRAAGEAKGRDDASPAYCDACFSGDYPVRPADQIENGFEMKAAE